MLRFLKFLPAFGAFVRINHTPADIAITAMNIDGYWGALFVGDHFISAPGASWHSDADANTDANIACWTYKAKKARNIHSLSDFRRCNITRAPGSYDGPGLDDSWLFYFQACYISSSSCMVLAINDGG
jgi:hypothetical protein